MKVFDKVTAVCLVFCMVFTLLPAAAFASSSDIREMLGQENSFGYMRVKNPDGGCAIYHFTEEESLEIFGSPVTESRIQPFNDFNYTVRAVFGEGRACEDSIVLVFFGDGFTEGNDHGDVGHWPNPATGTFLYHVQEYAYTFTNRYPFSLFKDYFKIYAVETPSTQQGIRTGTRANPIDAPYPGTYFGTFLPTNTSIGPRLREASAPILNVSNWVSSNSIITQLIINTTQFAGAAYLGRPIYENYNLLGVTSTFPGICHRSNRPLFHEVINHELGHSFGMLEDEHTPSGRWVTYGAKDCFCQVGSLLEHEKVYVCH